MRNNVHVPEVFNLIADECGYDTLQEANVQLMELAEKPYQKIVNEGSLLTNAPAVGQIKLGIDGNNYRTFINYYIDMSEYTKEQIEEYFEECQYFDHVSAQAHALSRRLLVD